MLLVALAAACDVGSCQPQEVAKVQPAHEAPVEPVDLVPATARAVVKTDRFDSLLKLVKTLAPRLPEVLSFEGPRKAWIQDFGFDPLDSDRWAAWGIGAADPAALYNDGESWVLVLKTQDAKVFDRWGEAYANTMDILASDDSGWRFARVTPKAKPDTAVSVAISDDYAFVLLPGSGATHASFMKAVTLSGQRPNAQLFRAQNWVVELSEKLEDQRMIAFVQPAEWLPKSQGEGQAQVIWQRMVAQMGPLAASAGYDPMRGEIELNIVSQTDVTQPAFVTSMGVARGELPVVGGLVDAGVLGVLRLSASPQNFYALVRSLMPASDRKDLDLWLKDVSKVLNLDVMSDLVTNLKGHAVIVVYGFDPAAFSPTNKNMMADFFSLDATREAVLLPIESGERLRNVLDAVTTLSDGKLNRQTVGDTVQYAWIEEGNLNWAIIVAADYAIVVDSTAAFDHAVIYARSARPLPKGMKDLGLDQLFDGNRSSLYMDSGALSNLMKEAGNAEVASWLAPFRSVLAWTQEGKKGDSVSTVILAVETEE